MADGDKPKRLLQVFQLAPLHTLLMNAQFTGGATDCANASLLPPRTASLAHCSFQESGDSLLTILVSAYMYYSMLIYNVMV